MAAFRNKDNGTWYVQFRYTDWKGERHQKLKRGFATKRDALAWEREFLMQKQADVNMTFESFAQLYEKDVKPKLKLNTWLTKESIIKKKILPYFGKRKLSEITAKDVMDWQNEIRELRDSKGKPYSRTYLRTVHNQLSTIFNHAIRYYGLQINPASKAGNMGVEERREMLFWTKDEYQIFVGNGVGYLGNAATGVVFPITVVGWGVSLLFGDGAAAALSVSLGRNETEDIHQSVGNSILGSFLSGVVIIIVSYLLGDRLLLLIGATDANLSLAHDYGFIIYAMMPLALVQNTLASIIRADGSPRYAMGAMLVGAILNIIGDPIAIFVLDMGIKGAAYATILGQFVSFVICAAYLTRSKTFKISRTSFSPNFILLKRMAALGTSSLLTQLSIVIITVINNILLVRYGAESIYGEDIPLAAFVVIMKLFQIVLNIAIGIAAGAQPIVGYNYGAKKYDRVKELLKLIVKWTTVICLICTALFEAIPLVFIRMFGADGELYTQFAVQCLRIYLVLIVFTCVQKVCAIFLQSIGHAKTAVPLSILRDVFLIVFSLSLPMALGVTGIFWAAPVADFIAIIITAVVMLRLWRQLGHQETAEAEDNAAILHPSKEGIILAISREHGSAGKRIGQLVAEKIGVPCYYKEMIALAARESGLSKEFISKINSNENAIMKELYLSTSVIQQAVTAQDKAIKQIAEKGSCVIIGRAADYVLRNNKNVIRIFIYAPEDYRINKVMEMYGDTKEEGRRSIARSDAARAAYYKSISGRNWGDPHEYELCIDSSIGAEATANIICDYFNRM